MIRVLLYGLGPIGVMVARQLAARDGFRIVGAVDIDPAKSGVDVAASPAPRPLRVKVSPDAGQAIKQAKPDVVVLCTRRLSARFASDRDVLKAKMPIVTTTEELSYPVRRNAALAKKIDRVATKAKVAVLSTGVNPGFVMDALPIALTVACERVESVDRQSRSGRAHTAPAVSAEDRCGLSPRTVRARGGARHRSGTWGSLNRSR